MMNHLPQLDPRNESDVVADVIENLPDEISDRNASSPEVKLIEAMGAFYGAILYMLNQVPRRLNLTMLALLGLRPEPATKASVMLQFTRSSDTTIYTVPAGTVVKTSTDLDAIRFETTQDLTFQTGQTSLEVHAEAIVAGSRGNVGANTLGLLDEPLSAIETVTNLASATGGLDEEPIAALEARAPLVIRAGERAITEEDFEVHTRALAGVSRSVTFLSPGVAAVHVLAEDLNETPNPALQALVKEELERRTLPSLTVAVFQPTVRLVRVTMVELELSNNAPALNDLIEQVHQTLAKTVTAHDVYADDGYSVLHRGWQWGRALHVNQLIAALGAIPGVARVGNLFWEYSDDYGDTWEVAFPVDIIQPLSANYGLLSYDTEHTPTVEVL